MISDDKKETLLEKEASFLSYYHQSKIPDPRLWPENSPVYLCASKRAEKIKYDLPGDCSSSPPFPLDGSIVQFDGPLFRGKIASRIRNAPCMNISRRKKSTNTTKEYFEGKSRKFQWTVQGTFKRRIRYDEVVTGQDFDRPFRYTPSASIVKKGIDLLKNRLPEGFECNLFGSKPKFEHPLITGCQGFRMDRPDCLAELEEHQLFGQSEDRVIIENSSLLGPEVPRSSEGRRDFFSNRENLQKFYYETDYIYTFEFYSNFFSPTRFRFEITPFFSFDLVPYFNGCPLFFAMAKEKSSGDFIFATEVWHKRLLEFEVVKEKGVIARSLSRKKRKKKTAST